MASQSVAEAFRKCTVMDKSLDQNMDEENSGRPGVLSASATNDMHGPCSGLVESAEVDQENSNNNKSSSRRNRQKAPKRLQTKSVLSSSENLSSANVGVTTLLRRSKVWDYATREEGTDFSICSLCADNKRISSNNGSTSTLRKHLVLVHKLHHLALPTKKNESAKSSISLNKKRELDDLLINCIVKDGRTFNDLQKSGMRKVVCQLAPGYEPPNRFAVARQLHNLHAFHYKKLVDELANVDHISVTTDFWSNRKMRSFLVITGHYFNGNDFNLQSKTLDFSTFDFQHTANEVSKILRTKLIELNIAHKVSRVTADGAPNMVRAIDGLGSDVKRVWCLAHRLHLAIVNAFGFWISKKADDEENSMEEEYPCNPTTDHEENTTRTNSSLDDFTSIQTQNYSESMVNVPIEIDCLNQQEELLNEVFDEEIIDNWNEGVIVSGVGIAKDQEKIILLIKKCRGLVSTIKRSTNITLFFDNERKKQKIYRNLCYDIKSRWNSTYIMIDSFTALRSIIETLFRDKHYLTVTRKQRDKLSELELTADDWNMLSALHSLLQRFFKATNALSVRNYPSIGAAFYILTRLKNYLQYHDRTDTSLTKRLKQLILPHFIHYFESDDQQMELLKFHAYFDPVGFLVLADSEKRSIEQSIKLIVINDVSGSIQQEASTTTTTQSTVDAMVMSSSEQFNLQEESAASAMDIFNESVGEYHSEINPRVSTTRSTIVEEIHNYRRCMNQFNANRKPDVKLSTLFWQVHGQSFVVLTKLAQQFLATPATSVASESSFSLSSYLGRKERSRLTGENLASSVFLKDKIEF